MGRRRKKDKTLAGTRIFKRRKDYWYEPKEPVLDPATSKIGKYHKLCPVSKGEFAARARVQQILGTVNLKKGNGDFSTWFQKWRDGRIAEKTKKAPENEERRKTHMQNIRNSMSWYRAIEAAFCEFDVAQIHPVDINTFLEQWKGQRTAFVLLSFISIFLQWCCANGVINTNPAREVKPEKPKKRKVHITDDQFEAILQAAPASGRVQKDGTRPIDHDGQMLQVYMELLYLLGQRGTDVRLLRWSSVSEKGIVVTPTKTESSSGKTVLLPMTPAIERSLNKARSIQTVKSKQSEYVIHDRKGNAYSAMSLKRRFDLVCKMRGIKGITLKDIRPKMATDALAQGYKEEDIQTALVHTDVATTRDYLRNRVIEVSHVRMELPGERNREQPTDAGDGAKQ